MDNNITLLKEKGLKVTPQRIAIVELLSLHGHLSISKLFELVRERFPSISLATIYKNLNSMVDNGFVNEVKLIGEDSRYELTKPSHSHVLCRECGDMRDIELSEAQIKSKVEELSHYKIDSSSLIFYGVCQECQKDS